MLRAVEAAHAGVGLRPDDEIQGTRPRFAAAECTVGKPRQSMNVPKIAAVAKIGQDGRYPGFVEGKELGVRHFA